MASRSCATSAGRLSTSLHIRTSNIKLRNRLARSYATYNTNARAATPGTVSSSVNHDEVTHFNALASSWWDPQGPSRLLHEMNPLRHEFIRQCRRAQDDHTLRFGGSAPTDQLRFLDVGCGGGIFAESAARRATTASVTAIDPTPEVLAVAQRHQRSDPLLMEPGRLTYLNTTIEELPRPASTTEGYDVVSLFEVVEHIQNPVPFLEACLAQVKPGGWFVGSTIARTATSWFTTKLIAEDVLRMVPQGTHTWSQYLQPQELQSWARSQPDLDFAAGMPYAWQVMGVVYVPTLGWRKITGSEDWGNYFFGVRKRLDV